jgi:hypothetical protein
VTGGSPLENGPCSTRLARYEELVSIHLAKQERLRGILSQQDYVILALDGLRPDVGHEVLWVLRDSVSGEILLARPLREPNVKPISRR